MTSKQAIRTRVWDALVDGGYARFPFPPHGRIPNFAGAAEAAERLLQSALVRRAQSIKVNPDAPQRAVRAGALRRGITVYMPTPRLRQGFWRLDPHTIPAADVDKAASLSHYKRWARQVPLDALPALDLIVCGAVAVTRDGRRCGKGEGYSDLEYAVLRELGHPEVPVATTVHPVQIVEDMPAGEHDLPVHLIATPDETIGVADPPPAPAGIDWDLLAPEAAEKMPVLAELKRRA